MTNKERVVARKGQLLDERAIAGGVKFSHPWVA
jgi:hypothetical protein